MTTSPRNTSARAIVPVALSLLLFGCSSIGPRSVVRDRFDYTSAIADSWKRQTLLNIVKLRYLDIPVHVDVGQVVAGYSLETDVSIGGTIASDGNELGLGAAGRYTDRPTITYQPLTGNRYIKAAMMPLPPDSIFFLIQAGWPADGVLFSAVTSLNGLKNQEVGLGGATQASPEFLRVLELLRKIQLSGGVALRIEQDKESHQTTLLAFHTAGITPETLKDIAELRRLLKLSPDAQEFRLVFAATPANDQEIAVLTRSLLHIMGMMAVHVEVPPEHVAEGRAIPGLSDPGSLRIHCSHKRPADAFATVSYRGLWFWIDDRDLKTKRAFGLLMMLFTLGDTGQKEPMTMITIPAQ